MSRIFSLAIAILGSTMIVVSASADDLATVEAFYTEILSKPSAADLNTTVETILAPDWKSAGDYSGTEETRDQFAEQMAGFGQLVPDLHWNIEEIIEAGDRYVVRGRATGTPADTFFGVDPGGRSFDIMSIDVHTVENGQIVQSYHIEDWAGALRQLSGQ